MVYNGYKGVKITRWQNIMTWKSIYLPVVIVFSLLAMSGCCCEEKEKLLKENAGLRTKIKNLEETDQSQFKKAVKMFEIGDYQIAISEWEILINTYPNSSLLAESKKRIALAKRKNRELKKKQAQKERLNGIGIAYIDFYAKLNDSVPNLSFFVNNEGYKRYRLRSRINAACSLIMDTTPSGRNFFVSPQFDEKDGFKKCLEGSSGGMHRHVTVVVSRANEGIVRLHRVEERQ